MLPTSADQGRGFLWRPISELSPDADRILAFVPDHWAPNPRGFDERVCIVERTERGWRFDHSQGGYIVEPTMFCLIELPDGVPADPR